MMAQHTIDPDAARRAWIALGETITDVSFTPRFEPGRKGFIKDCHLESATHGYDEFHTPAGLLDTFDMEVY